MVLLGSTGSIGVNTLRIAQKYNIAIEALVAGDNIELLNQQIALHKPKFVAIRESAKTHLVNHPRVYSGNEGIETIIEQSCSDTVVNALVGYAGMLPTIKAIKMNKKIALANKESLVVAGEFIDTSRITPIDSEHFGLWYLLNDKKTKQLIITASGGAFRDWSIEAMHKATFKEALNHPNWSMGSKITIDSATMTNKLFELLEARWLFGTTQLDGVIERRSIVHALVEFVDGSTTAHFAGVDMRLPIAYALLDSIEDEILPSVDLLKMGAIGFEAISPEKYPIWQIKSDILTNPHLGVVINAANEEAIELFKQGTCSFFGMSDRVLECYQKFHNVKPTSIEDIIAIDREVRRYSHKLVGLPSPNA
ncbi:MAG: 1-deoxy-D-xylulose 5-phosphate reductoisomerase [Sulfurovum sp. FS08-3]|nr:MAG: 1-deoxy-D-xylulose 5-phosphate reductoisomerase [Sulfurovum sp. FS08-3]